MAVAGGPIQIIDTGFAIRCNNDHGLSPDGALLAISDQSQGGPRVAGLHCSLQRRHTSARHPEISILLARMVARWANSGVRR